MGIDSGRMGSVVDAARKSWRSRSLWSGREQVYGSNSSIGENGNAAESQWHAGKWSLLAVVFV